MKKILIRLIGFIVLIYCALCTYMFLEQERFIFLPEKLTAKEKLEIDIPFKEVAIPVNGAKLSGLLCTVHQRKGLIFFVHGNKGNLNDQQQAARFYTSLGYDFFSFDYRGYGKSTGQIESEAQFFNDVVAAYKYCLKDYQEDEITLIGYSLGTAPASYLATKSRAHQLILIAPYFSLKKMTIHRYKVIPTFLLKYPFETNEHVKKAKQRILIVHGDKDAVLPFEGGKALTQFLGKDDRFLRLPNQGHDDLEKNPQFRKAIRIFLGIQ